MTADSTFATSASCRSDYQPEWDAVIVGAGFAGMYMP